MGHCISDFAFPIHIKISGPYNSFVHKNMLFYDFGWQDGEHSVVNNVTKKFPACARCGQTDRNSLQITAALRSPCNSVSMGTKGDSQKAPLDIYYLN